MQIKINKNVFKKIEIECPDCKESFLLKNVIEYSIDIANDYNFESADSIDVSLKCPICDKWIFEAIFIEMKK